VIFSEYGAAAASGLSYPSGLSYLGLHFLLYFCVLRNWPFFQSERGIFDYHFWSATAFSLAALAAGMAHFGDTAIATSLGLIAAHGIYSTSFLELWSLAQGSYSISILTGVAASETLQRTKLIDLFTQIGNSKKSDRLSVLSKSSLACHDGRYWRLSSRGRVLAKILTVLLWFAAVKRPG
jgi:hypothetical protein